MAHAQAKDVKDTRDQGGIKGLVEGVVLQHFIGALLDLRFRRAPRCEGREGRPKVHEDVQVLESQSLPPWFFVS